MIDLRQREGMDVTKGLALLDTFQTNLGAAIRDKKEAEKALAQRLSDLFEGVKGRPSKTDRELSEWLASPEGKAATGYESTSLSRWGEIGRS